MPWLKALLVALPLALAGGWATWSNTARIDELRREVEQLDARGRAEGDAFVATLSRADAERQLATLDRRKEAVVALAGARRNRLLGVLLLVASALAALAVRAGQRVAAEVAEDGGLADVPPRA